jgi:hypothetical protein
LIPSYYQSAGQHPITQKASISEFLQKIQSLLKLLLWISWTTLLVSKDRFIYCFLIDEPGSALGFYFRNSKNGISLLPHLLNKRASGVVRTKDHGQTRIRCSSNERPWTNAHRDVAVTPTTRRTSSSECLSHVFQYRTIQDANRTPHKDQERVWNPSIRNVRRRHLRGSASAPNERSPTCNRSGFLMGRRCRKTHSRHLCEKCPRASAP